jgi:hypothetical protein
MYDVRTAEWMPSVAKSRSAEAVVPSAKVAVISVEVSETAASFLE